MPIQILDNFEVNVAKPIDNRFVVGSQSFYTNKEQIPYRYPGLRIWDLNDNFPYIWTGVTWSNENQSGTVIGIGNLGRLPKFFGSSDPTSNIINSQIFDDGTRIAIDSTTPLTTDKLFINGNGRNVRLSGTGSFIGNGSQLTSLNATNITSGSLSLNRITDGALGQILVRGTSNAEFVNSNTITVGTSSVANNLVVNTVSDTNIYSLLFSNVTGLPSSKTIFTNSSSIRIQASTGNVGIGTNPSTNRLTVSGTVSIIGGNVGIGTFPSTTNRLTVSGTVRITGGTPSAGKFLMSENSNGDARWENSIPVGSIIMWGGVANAIPSGWLLCNGQALFAPSPLRDQLLAQGSPFGTFIGGTPKIPDLRERFVVGAGSGSTYSVGATGGANNVTLTKAQIPKHQHTIGSGDSATMTDGTHTHQVPVKTVNTKDGAGSTEKVVNDPADSENEGTQNYSANTTGSSHTHTGVTGDGASDSLAGQSHENRPPFFALCYIIKTGL